MIEYSFSGNGLRWFIVAGLLLIALPTSISMQANAWSDGDYGGSCCDFANTLPADQQVQVIELQKQFYLKTDDELDRVIFDEDQTCKIVECGILEPRKVVKLAEFVKENKRAISTKEQVTNQFWLGFAVNFVFALAALVLGVLNFRKSK